MGGLKVTLLDWSYFVLFRFWMQEGSSESFAVGEVEWIWVRGQWLRVGGWEGNVALKACQEESWMKPLCRDLKKTHIEEGDEDPEGRRTKTCIDCSKAKLWNVILPEFPASSSFKLKHVVYYVITYHQLFAFVATLLHAFLILKRIPLCYTLLLK